MLHNTGAMVYKIVQEVMGFIEASMSDCVAVSCCL